MDSLTPAELAELDKMLERLARHGNALNIGPDIVSYLQDDNLESAAAYIGAARSNVQSAIVCIRRYMDQHKG